VAIGHHWPNGEVYDSVTATHSNVPFLPTGTWAENVAINNLGQITGEAGSSPSDWMGHAFVYINGVMVDLNTVTNGIPAGKTLLEGMFINDAGQIIVWTDSTNYLLLTPEASVPEPGTWWLVGLAVAAGRSLRRVLRRR
jgi:probable HAF family extracellular repeat protein